MVLNRFSLPLVLLILGSLVTISKASPSTALTGPFDWVLAVDKLGFPAAICLIGGAFLWRQLQWQRRRDDRKSDADIEQGRELAHAYKKLGDAYLKISDRSQEICIRQDEHFRLGIERDSATWELLRDVKHLSEQTRDSADKAAQEARRTGKIIQKAADQLEAHE